MRKKHICLVLLVLFAALTLTSCTVNWFDKKFNVPWLFVAVPTLILVLFVWIFAGKHISRKLYVCPKCGNEFHPRWYKAAISLHINDDRLFKCPYCGERSFCYPSYINKL